jgi:acyl-coenzyme A thioesterase 13
MSKIPEVDLSNLSALIKRNIGRVFEESTSPFHRWLAPVILAVETGEVELKYNIRPEMLNPMNTLHGGVTAAIVDDAIGVAVFSLGKKSFHTTVNVVVDYLAPCMPGDNLIVKASVLKNGKTLVHGQCEMYSEKTGKLLSRGIANLMYLGPLLENK